MDTIDEIQLEDGTVRRLGNIAPDPNRTKVGFPVFGDTPTARLIPRSEWDELLAGYSSLDSFDPFVPPVHDQNGVGQCFPRGTLIRMADGSQKPIEEVRVLDEVLTAEGRTKPVLRTMVRRATTLVRIHVHGHRHLRCTDEHPVLTKRGYVKAGDLTREDFVAIPRYAPATANIIQTADYITHRTYTRRQAVVGSRVYGVPGKTAAVVTRCAVPDVIHLTREFGWVIGMYLAEGSTGHGKADWSLNVNETETHAARLIKALGDSFGVTAVIRKVSGKSTKAIKVTVYGVQWAKLLESLCAAGSGNKRLHPDLASGNRDFLEGVLEGWTDGDGLGDNRNGGVTVSHQLAVGMFDIANALGKKPTVESQDVKTYGNVASRQRRYTVRWGNKSGHEDYRSNQDETHLWRRVAGVVAEEFDGWVYNMEVADDNSYVAEGIGVHNCNASTTTLMAEYLRARQGLPHIRLSAADLYHRINWGRDGGSLLEDALKEMLTNGVGTVASCGYLWKSGEFKGPASAAERARFRFLEVYECPTFDHYFSSILQGFVGNTGILWYNNYTPGADGWLPRGSGGAGGHAIFGYKPTKRGNEYGIWHQNSWGPNWPRQGAGGRFVIPESAYTGPVGGWFAVRSIVDEGGIVPPEVA